VFALLVVAGCKPSESESAGDLVGVYAINGALVTNTCGQMALPAVNPLKFEVEIRQDDRVGYWQTDKQPQRSGELDDDGTFMFIGEQTSLVSSMRGARELEPGDFVTLAPDFDLKTTNCAMRVKETIEGSVVRRVILVDGGEPQIDDANPGSKHDLTGDNTIEVTATPDSDCSKSLAAYGGPFANLPCMAHYVLSGDLEKSKSVE
jgi:hypothetical protein